MNLLRLIRKKNEGVGTFGHNLPSFYETYQDSINISLLAAISVLVFYNSLSSYFLPVDDFGPVVHSTKGISDIFTTDTYGRHGWGNYRPMEELSHVFDSYLYGHNNPFGRHLTNLVVHIANGILVYIIASHLTRKKMVGLVAGLFFVIHPIHSQSLSPVTWIAGRMDLVVSFFCLLTILFFMRFLSKGSYLIYLTSFAAFILALSSKETAVTLPVVILLYVLLFPSYQEGVGAFSSKQAYRMGQTLLLGGILLIVLGILLSPNFIASYISPDGILLQSTVKKIHFLQSGLIGGGLIIVLATLLLKLSKKTSASKLLLILPYFVILLFYFAARVFALGGVVGKGYQTAGGNLISNLRLDAFMRDVFSLVGLVWPVGADYNIDILTLQIEHIFIFFAVSIIVSIALALILFKLIIQSRVLTFSYLWIFITLMPVHNLLIPVWTFQSRYLYLPSVGFCIFISILLYNLTQPRNIPSRLAKIVAIAFILLILSLNSIFIIKHNEKLARSGEIMRKFVSGIKRHQSKISDTADLYFITLPLSPIDTNSNIWITVTMNDILNFANNSNNSNGYEKRYNYTFLLFVQGEENSQVNITRLNDRDFIIDGISSTNFFLIPNKPSSTDKRIKEIYKRFPTHAMLQALPPEGETKETNEAIITALKLDKKSNGVKLKVELKEPLSELTNHLFFIYEKGDFQLVEEFYGGK